jgi:hypothetical protein
VVPRPPFRRRPLKQLALKQLRTSRMAQSIVVSILKEHKQ